MTEIGNDAQMPDDARRQMRQQVIDAERALALEEARTAAAPVHGDEPGQDYPDPDAPPE